MSSTANDFRDGPLAEDELERIEQARTKAHVLYEGKVTPHRSCGVCLAETFGLPWRPYQALRRGGLTGEGECGAIRAGEMILGDLLGPEGPTDPAPERLRRAVGFYREQWKRRQEAAGWPDRICNTLVAPHGDFHGPARAAFCTNMAAETAALVAEALIRAGHDLEVEPFSAEESARTPSVG